MMTQPYTEIITGFRPITELLPSHWQAGDMTLSDGGTLHYLQTDNNHTPMICIHGVQVDGRMWLRTALQLESDYDVIMPDVRGHGLSSAMPTDLDEDTLSNDLVSLVDSLSLSQPPILIGHSMGADIALRLATKIDSKHVILVDPALVNIIKLLPPMDQGLPDYMQPVVETIAKLPSLSHTERMSAGYTLVPPGTQGWHELDYVSFVEGQSRFDMSSYQRFGAMGYVIESPETIAKVHCPITLLTAKQMMMQPEQFNTAISIFTDNWQSGEHIHFANSGHFIPFDQFERFIEIIRRIQ